MLYIWTFILWTFLIFAITKLKEKYLTYIWKWKNNKSIDFHMNAWKTIVIFLMILITIFFLSPFIFNYFLPFNPFIILIKEFFYIITWTIWVILIIITIIIPSKKKLKKEIK